MNRRSFVKRAALLSLAARPRSTYSALSVKGGSDTAFANQATQYPLGARFELTLGRVLHGGSPAYSEEFVLADVRPTPERRFTEYSGDVSGRYIGALATAARVYGTAVPNLDALVTELIALQKPDGYFGNTFHYEKPTDLDMALLWGNGRLLVGLLEYHRLRRSDQVLNACRSIGDFLMRIAPLMLSKEIRDAFGAQHFASSYICWTQQTEGLAKLYAITREERYRGLAEDIAAVIERRPGDHVHGYLTSLRGVMDLHQETGDKQLLRQCEASWQDIVSSRDLLITGGVPEGWSPNNHRTEGCAEADWVRLNLALWRATNNSKYLAMAERAIFNELAFNQFATGDFGHRVYTETGLPAAGAVRAWWCCTLHGLRCFPDIHTNVFRREAGNLWYDLPLDGRIESDSLALAAESSSSLAEDGTVRIRITETGKQPATLNIRKPEWADRIEIVNGGPLKSESREGMQYLSMDRIWKTGDVVRVKYAMQIKPMPTGENRIAFSYGPWLLGVAASNNPHYFNELTTENRLISDGKPALASHEQGAGPFSIPVATTTFQYAQAEYPDQPEPVTLRPIAEQTGQATTSWELRLLAEKRI